MPTVLSGQKAGREFLAVFAALVKVLPNPTIMLIGPLCNALRLLVKGLTCTSVPSDF